MRVLQNKINCIEDHFDSSIIDYIKNTIEKNCKPDDESISKVTVIIDDTGEIVENKHNVDEDFIYKIYYKEYTKLTDLIEIDKQYNFKIDMIMVGKNYVCMDKLTDDLLMLYSFEQKSMIHFVDVFLNVEDRYLHNNGYGFKGQDMQIYGDGIKNRKTFTVSIYSNEKENYEREYGLRIDPGTSNERPSLGHQDSDR